MLQISSVIFLLQELLTTETVKLWTKQLSLVTLKSSEETTKFGHPEKYSEKSLTTRQQMIRKNMSQKLDLSKIIWCWWEQW